MKNQDQSNPPKITYFGTSDFAVTAFKLLIQNGYNITAVITQPEKPVGRAKMVVPSPVKKAALENNILVFEPHNLKNNDEFLKHFKLLDSDVGIVASYGKIIPSQILEMPRLGFLNIHPSLLPKYRGPSPIQTAILNGDMETGVTIMKLDEGMDSGPVLENIKYKIQPEKYYKEIESELAYEGAKLLLEILPRYIAAKINPKEQDHSKTTFTKMLDRKDGKINWNKPAYEIFNQIRALNPEPGTWAKWKDRVFNIKSGLTLPKESAEIPGTVINVDNQIAVATSKCYLILKQIQLEGGKEMDVKAFLNGHPDFLGSKLE